MIDETESIRREMIENGQVQRDLATASPRWSTEQLREDFEVISFMAPFVVVKRKNDGAWGTLRFTHQPRVYFDWQEDRK